MSKQNPLTQIIFVQKVLLFAYKQDPVNYSSANGAILNTLTVSISTADVLGMTNYQRQIRNIFKKQLSYAFVCSAWRETMEQFDTLLLFWFNNNSAVNIKVAVEEQKKEQQRNILQTTLEETETEMRKGRQPPKQEQEQEEEATKSILPKPADPNAPPTFRQTLHMKTTETLKMHSSHLDEHVYRCALYLICYIGNPFYLDQFLRLVSFCKFGFLPQVPRTVNRRFDQDDAESERDEDGNELDDSSKMRRQILKAYFTGFLFHEVDFIKTLNIANVNMSELDFYKPRDLHAEKQKHQKDKSMFWTPVDTMPNLVRFYSVGLSENHARNHEIEIRRIPLHLCAIMGHIDCCRVLLRVARVDLNVTDAANVVHKKTALFKAVKYGHYELVKHLYLDCGALLIPEKMHANDCDGMRDVAIMGLSEMPPPVAESLHKNSEFETYLAKIYDLLLEPCCKITERFTHYSLFYTAAVNCHADLLRQIFYRFQTKEGLTDEQRLKYCDPRDTFGNMASTPAHGAIHGGMPDELVAPTLHVLLSNTKDVKSFLCDQFDLVGDTLLCAASKRGLAKTIEVILSFHMDCIFVRSLIGNVTCLHFAAVNNHANACRALVEAEPTLLFETANVSLTSKAITPREWAESTLRSASQDKGVSTLLSALERTHRDMNVKYLERKKREDAIQAKFESEDDDQHDENIVKKFQRGEI